MEAAWSPDGKKLALWPLARRVQEIGESQGLERFLPPVGTEDATLSDAEIIERYFQKILALGPKALNNYLFFLLEYAKALEEMGKPEAAEEQYRKGIEVLRSEEKWRGRVIEAALENAYADFLRRQQHPTETPRFPAGQEVFHMDQNGRRQSMEPPPAPQKSPLVYIIAVPERGE
jgi:tetratricopeptide (TPR) repeat protein